MADDDDDDDGSNDDDDDDDDVGIIIVEGFVKLAVVVGVKGMKLAAW